MSRRLPQKDAIVKLIVGAGQASPSPPVGPALGSKGVKSIDFCKEFNALTAHLTPHTPIPALITIRPDRSFSFVLRTPPTSTLLLSAAGAPEGKGGKRRGANAPGRAAAPTTASLTAQLSPVNSAISKPGKDERWSKSARPGEDVGRGAVVQVSKEAGADKGPGHGGGTTQVGEVSLKHVYEIARVKATEERLGALGMKALCKSILGQARSCGVGVVP